MAAKLLVIGFQLVLYPLYSPDLASSDSYLFSNAKGKRFSLNEAIIIEKNTYFTEFNEFCYSERISKTKTALDGV